jgi:phospholipase A-2-activating protein
MSTRISENPWSAAERFLNKHELPLGYTDQVVAFIEKNTAGVQLGTTYSDPYTGSSRYQSSAPTQTANVYRDPLTGERAAVLVPRHAGNNSGPL